ncbi:MAG TPA: type IV pilus assembly protein PilM [Solirubrobacteraceae bacterium]|nr:type IV pilus assembly protein PilM [Solirubrobacteraceae bacterium]
MLKRNRKNSQSTVGLDLDPSHIAAAEVSVNGSITLTRGAVVNLRPGILRDGEVTDAPALTEALKAFFAENGLPNRVRLGVANQRIVVRTLDLPPLEDPKALTAAVRAEAPDHIPMPMDEAILDFQPLGLVQTATGPRMRVVIVAVRREMIDRLVGATRDAGLKLEGIDLAAFAMVRALAPSDAEGAVLYINLAGLTNVAVANRTGCLFTRAAAGGLDSLVTILAERRGLTLEHARQWISHVALAAPIADLEGDPELLAAARAVLEEGVHQLADTVRNSLNFYRTQENAENVERALLTGPAVSIAGFAERLSEQLKLPVEPVLVGVDGIDGLGELDAGRLTVAAGLAVEDRA